MMEFYFTEKIQEVGPPIDQTLAKFVVCTSNNGVYWRLI